MTDLEINIKQHFGVINQEDLQKISSLFHLQTVQKGAYFLKTGKTCDKLSFVQAGLFRIYVTTDSKEVTQWISTPGHFITDLSSLLFESLSRWTIQALTDADL